MADGAHTSARECVECGTFFIWERKAGLPGRQRQRCLVCSPEAPSHHKPKLARPSSCQACGAEIHRPGMRGRKPKLCGPCKAKPKPRRPIGEPRAKHIENVCIECGGKFMASKRAKHCSQECRYVTRHRSSGRLTKAELLGRAQCNQDHRCERCERSFRPKRSDRLRFCSRDCAFAELADRSAVNRAAKAARQPTPPPLRRCTECSVEFRAHHSTACSESCRKRRACRKARELGERRHVSTRGGQRPCAGCGEHFAPAYGLKNRLYCSDRCAQRTAQRIGKAMRRARVRAAKIERVDPIRVMERDGWKCQECGRTTPRRLRGTTSPRAPELDHIEPLAAGGAHSYRNTRCLCRECNQRKSDGAGGQLLLFG